MYKIISSIFRAYDIRGKYPDEINAATAYAVARAFVRFLKKESGQENLTVCVGKDARVSSQELFEGLVRGAGAEGAKVVDLGLAMTPAVFFAIAHYGYDGGVNITASHNPNPFNGFKLLRKGGLPIGGDSGLKEIQALADGFLNDAFAPMPPLEKKDFISDYIDETLALTEVGAGVFAGMNIAVDAGNGTVGEFLNTLLRRFPDITCTRLYFEPDGNFPHHDPDPTMPKNLADLQALMKRGKYTLGAAFDGDADRVVFLDENGAILGGDMTLALIAPILLRKHPGSRIIYDILSSKVAAEAIAANGGVPAISKVGQAFIKPQMQRENAFFAAEMSGHFTIGDGKFYEVPFMVLLLILQEIAESGRKLSELVADVGAKWHHSGYINFEVDNKEKVLKTLEERFSDGKISKLDGVRADYPEWWFAARPSNTEPLLRLVVEETSEEMLQERVRELRGIIENMS